MPFVTDNYLNLKYDCSNLLKGWIFLLQSILCCWCCWSRCLNVNEVIHQVLPVVSWFSPVSFFFLIWLTMPCSVIWTILYFCFCSNDVIVTLQKFLSSIAAVWLLNYPVVISATSCCMSLRVKMHHLVARARRFAFSIRCWL